MLSVEKVKEVIKDILENNNIIKSKVSIIEEKPRRLEICIQKEDGTMDLDTCDQLSQLISTKLDEYDKDDENYVLDVCSFGAEMQFEINEINQYINQYVHIEFKEPKEGKENIEGYLLEDNQEDSIIEYMDKNIKKKFTVNHDNIKLIRLAVKL